MIAAKKLPKGYKWSDGRKFKYSVGKDKGKGNTITYTLLPAENDLYIKGAYLVGTPRDFKGCIYIKDYKNITVRKIHDDYLRAESTIDTSSLLIDSLTVYYKENGLQLGYTMHYLRGLSPKKPEPEEGQMSLL